ncbi:hypothetical protein WI666_17885, partial [Vibrio cholerae]
MTALSYRARRSRRHVLGWSIKICASTWKRYSSRAHSSCKGWRHAQLTPNYVYHRASYLLALFMYVPTLGHFTGSGGFSISRKP